jgi:non-lysosomal glucosylceramidase
MRHISARTSPKGSCCPHSTCGVERRDFIKLAAVGVAASLVPGMRAVAGPFDASDFEKLVPADKKLDPEWVKSLFARGRRSIYKGAELEKIGMPVGGICAGQLYLGGDGKLWYWDIFNKQIGTGSGHYAKPLTPSSPLEQGFALKVTAGGTTRVRTLDRAGFRDVSFCGEYPIGFVEYGDAESPASVSLEAFSPFIPLDADDSSLPATVMHFTIKNTGAKDIDAEIGGWIENVICAETSEPGEVVRRNHAAHGNAMTFLECSAAPARTSDNAKPARPDIVFDDFEKEAYEGWTVSGAAFGSGPIERAKIPHYQGDLGGEGKRVVNSHASAPGEGVGAKDNATGKLTSREFKIERKFITFFIGGGNNPGKTCMNLLVDGKVARSATGKNENKMRPAHFDVRELEGKSARLEIVDDKQGPWGNIGIDQIVFADTAGRAEPLENRRDFGTMGLALLGEGIRASVSTAGAAIAEGIFSNPGEDERDAEKPGAEKLVGALSRKLALAPGESKTVTFIVAWHFPNNHVDAVRTQNGRRYAARFPNANAVAAYVSTNVDRLTAQTRLWHDTWYDSTLPFWLLDRAFLNTSILASSTCHWFPDGRFYAWEGVGCCPGTCTHVWHYAHAVSRVFPELERDLRERTDFGLAFDEKTGVIRFRGESAGLAIDGQAGCILRSLREHQMSGDDAFLKRNWPKIKRALQCLIEQPGGADGLLNGAQHNTLDTSWYGPVAWLNSLYLAALGAGGEMAREAGDEAFARQCAEILRKGRTAHVAQLFEGEYFVNKPDPARGEAINSGTGCEIDQVMGQSWASQIGLDRILPEEETRAALRALWRYNFTPDVGPYRAVNKPGRWYAMPGEGGLLICTFPRVDWNYKKASGRGPDWAAGYFNECMNGFEYQAAGHMIAEGMVMEGLAITRMAHDRYHPSRRNPWNEVECGDHYSRSMASYGVFISACGFEYHGPSGHIGFAPRISPENFRAPFTSADGWGTFTQKADGAALSAEILMKWGKLRARTFTLELPAGAHPSSVHVTAGGRGVDATFALTKNRAAISLSEDVHIAAGEKIEIRIA